jgi:cytochrome c-type biogenesis protein
MNDVNVVVAFSAGMLSFLAPCVIPLLPAYVSFISGVSVSELTKKQPFKQYFGRVFVNSLFFIIGFTCVFVTLGFGATTLARTLVSYRQLLLQLGGVLILLFGIIILLGDKLKIFQRGFSWPPPAGVRKIRFLGPFAFGISFALAWTPCVGPILGAVLTIAATSRDYLASAVLLGAYSLGITIPFLVLGLTLGSSYKGLNRVARVAPVLNLVAGVMLISLGVLMILGKLSTITSYFVINLYQLPFYSQLMGKI